MEFKKQNQGSVKNVRLYLKANLCVKLSHNKTSPHGINFLKTRSEKTLMKDDKMGDSANSFVFFPSQTETANLF